MTPRYWNANTPTAPSQAIERDAVVPIAELLGVPPCGWDTLHESITTSEGHAVIMHANGGWGAGREYQPSMQMSFYTHGIDHTIPVIANPPARGELHIVQCDGVTAHIAYWPNCGNLSLLTPTNTRTGEPFNQPTEPTTIPEPSTLVLVLLGLLILLWRTKWTVPTAEKRNHKTPQNKPADGGTSATTTVCQGPGALHAMKK